MSHLNCRRIIKIGNNSLAVTLPKPWIDYYQLKKGDELRVISNGNIQIIPIKKLGEGLYEPEK